MGIQLLGSSHEARASSDALIRQAFRTLLPVQILSVATPTLTSILNGILIGNYLPPEALVALGFVVPVNALLGSLSLIISSGARVFCGRFIGRGEIKKLDYAFTASLTVIAVMGALLTLIMLFCAAPIASLLGADGVSAAATAEYLKGLAVGIIPMMMIPCLMVFLQMENESNYALLSTLVLAAGSLIFGIVNLNVFDASIYGMGLASSAAQYVTFLFLAVHIARSKTLMKLDIHGIGGKLIPGMIKVGFPAALANILYSLRNVILNSVALKIGGTQAVASLAILNSAASPFDAVNVGFGAVVLMFASIIVGERNRELLNALFKFSIKLGIILGVIKISIICASARYITMLFGAEGTLIDTSSRLFIMYSFSMPLNAIVLSFISTYQNLGKVRYINIIYIFSCMIVPVGSALGLGALIGTDGIWICYAIAEIFTITVLFAVPWIRSRRVSFDPGVLLMTDDEFGNGAKLSIPLRTLDEAVDCSRSINEFCLANGVDARRSRLCGLCAEEMSVNIIEHGFTKTKKHSLGVEVFLLIDGGTVNLRIMDNAPHFDPSEKLKYTDPDDPCKNIGIRMVAKLADEMEYRSTFGMNVLHIKL